MKKKALADSRDEDYEKTLKNGMMEKKSYGLRVASSQVTSYELRVSGLSQSIPISPLKSSRKDNFHNPIFAIDNMVTFSTVDSTVVTKVSLSKWGIYYASNWLGTQNKELFRIDLPTGWWDDLRFGG